MICNCRRKETIHCCFFLFLCDRISHGIKHKITMHNYFPRDRTSLMSPLQRTILLTTKYSLPPCLRKLIDETENHRAITARTTTNLRRGQMTEISAAVISVPNQNHFVTSRPISNGAAKKFPRPCRAARYRYANSTRFSWYTICIA